MLRKWGFLAVIALLAWVAAVVALLSGRGSMRADPADATQVAQGRTIYLQHCASCHGVNLEGQPNWQRRLPNGRLPAPPHDASGHTWHHPDRVLFDITKHGLAAHAPAGYESDMPGFAAALSDKEIWAVLAFIKSTWPAPVRERQAAIDARAR